MNRSFFKITIFLLSSAVLGSCGDKKAAPNPDTLPVAVNIIPVTAEKINWYERFPGTIVATSQVDIRAVIEGYVTGIFFREGEQVQKGQKLYTIDDSKYQAVYSQTQANIRVAEANVAQAQKDADRYNYLNEHDAVAKQTLDHAVTTLQNAKSQLQAAKQDLVKAQTDIGYAVIKAPFAGTIGISQVRLGNAVVPGQTTLNTISAGGPVAVDIVVNEKQLGQFIRLQKKKNNAADSIFTLLTPDNKPYGYPGEIAIIDRGVNPQTGTLTVRLQFPNPGDMLRSGMSCLVRVRSDDTSKQVTIPAKAIVEQMGEYFVYVAKDTMLPAAKDAGTQKEKPAGPAFLAKQKRVMMGQTIGDRVIIKDGLQEGDSLITDGVQKLHDGSLLTLDAPKK